MKASEYGGSDTHKTLGIQPAPHTLTPEEKLRVMYRRDPAEPELTPILGLDEVTQNDSQPG
jgi:hypothetical protein